MRKPFLPIQKFKYVDTSLNMNTSGFRYSSKETEWGKKNM